MPNCELVNTIELPSLEIPYSSWLQAKLLQALESQLGCQSKRCSQLEVAEQLARTRHDQLLQDKLDVTAFLRSR